MNTGQRFGFSINKIMEGKKIIYGGVGSVLNTRSKILNVMSQNEEVGGNYPLEDKNLISFEVDSFNNLMIELNAALEYRGMSFRNDGGSSDWEGSNELTFILDKENAVINYGTVSFSGQDNNIIADMATDNVTSYGFRDNTRLKRYINQRAVVYEGHSNFKNCSNLQRVDLRNLKDDSGSFPGAQRPFNGTGGLKIYAHPNWQTHNATASSFNHAISLGWEIVVAQNSNVPNPVTGIQINNITSNSVDVSFNQSIDSVNAIDFYDVYVYDGNILTKINPVKEIQGTSTTVNIPNPDPQISYRILVRAVDIYFNFSEYAESNSFLTL